MRLRTLILTALLLALIYLGSGCSTTPRGEGITLPPPPPVRY